MCGLMFDCLASNLCCLGKLVRELKAQGSDKSQIDLEVKKLLELKGQYKLLAGQEWTSSAGGGGGTKKKERGKVESHLAEPKGEADPSVSQCGI